jgi:RNA polymerase sigma-70 factor (ECF subfamily)
MSGVGEAIERTYRDHWGRIQATLIRFFADFDLAEEAAQEAFALAAERWAVEGVPQNPRAWIVSTARHKAIDRVRREANLRHKQKDIEATFAPDEPAESDPDTIADDLLRLIFTCCHPALALEVQVALTLRTVLGLETGEIARAFLVPETTMAQRLVRAKKKIAGARIPYRVPDPSELPERLAGVHSAVYLVFNEGYAATAGEALVRADLCAEAIRLGRLLASLEDDRETLGLLALMLLHDARRATRIDAGGVPILLADQDRARWDRVQIAEALPLVERAMASDEPGPYALQAAIAATHCRADLAPATDWSEILRLYDVMSRLYPSPVVELNRAVAVAMLFGPAAGLHALETLVPADALADYHLLPAARADLLRRLGRADEARADYARALSLVRNDPERRFLEARLRELDRH